jgi:hypothetical protein
VQGFCAMSRPMDIEAFDAARNHVAEKMTHRKGLGESRHL